MARVSIFRQQAMREAMESSTQGRKEIAEEILDDFRTRAPRRSGTFAGSATVKVDGSRVYVVDDDPLAFYKEYGTSRTRAAAALTNAARQRGKYTGFQPRGSRGRSR